MAATGIALAGALLMPIAKADAQSVPAGVQLAQAGTLETDAPPRRAGRPLRRLRIYPRNEPDEVYPRYNPGPNAVRDCTATYVKEARPSGTVITPRMNCFWRPG